MNSPDWPRWHALHPDIDVRILSLQYADHHNAMTTALATGSGLPDVMGKAESLGYTERGSFSSKTAN